MFVRVGGSVKALQNNRENYERTRLVENYAKFQNSRKIS